MADSLPILVPVGEEFDLRAVHCAIQLADLLGVGVRVLSVTRHHDFMAAREEALQKSLDELPVAEVRVFVHEDPAAAIADCSASASLICMTTAATLVPHGGHFGSIAENVVRNVEIPVVLLGPKASGPFEARRVVVPVDGSDAAEYMVPDAATFSDAIGAEVWFVTVESKEQESMISAVAGSDAGAIESGYVMHLARRLGRDVSQTPQFEVLHGKDVAEAILEFAEPDAVIAMSTHGRTGLKRIFAGSVTTHVVAGSSQPTLVMRPPDAILVGD
ncbi:MAG: universal stress protein [Acidimicrobiia bacterium]|nr:universal stress protein [Acidimicrobiia bacterium]